MATSIVDKYVIVIPGFSGDETGREIDATITITASESKYTIYSDLGIAINADFYSEAVIASIDETGRSINIVSSLSLQDVAGYVSEDRDITSAINLSASYTYSKIYLAVSDCIILGSVLPDTGRKIIGKVSISKSDVKTGMVEDNRLVSISATLSASDLVTYSETNASDISIITTMSEVDTMLNLNNNRFQVFLF